MSRSPRVLQIALSLNAGGTERLIVELARRLHSDVPTAVCCLDEEGTWAPELKRVGIEVDALHRAPGFAPGLSRRIADAASRHRATVIHCHHYSPFVYGALARLWQPKARVVYTEHGRLSDTPPSRKRRLANVVFAHLPSAVLAVSGELRQHLVQEGFAPKLGGVIYNGIDVGPLPSEVKRRDMRARLNVLDETLVVGTIARLDPVKDLGTLIKAVARLESNAVLMIIGDGPERETLQHVASAAGVTERIRFLGHREDAREWLAACDVYTNSSISEGVSLTILEAMAAGLPIIATRVGGTPEVVDAPSGQLVPARDPQAMALALAEMHRDAERRRRMASAARRRVETHFTLERMVSEYRAVYERLT